MASGHDWDRIPVDFRPWLSAVHSPRDRQWRIARYCTPRSVADRRGSHLAGCVGRPTRTSGHEVPMPTSFYRTLTSLMLSATFVALASDVRGATYDVGPGQSFETPSAVPWESLQPGDVVRIHWRATPYRDKWVIARAGTATAPIVVQG